LAEPEKGSRIALGLTDGLDPTYGNACSSPGFDNRVALFEIIVLKKCDVCVEFALKVLVCVSRDEEMSQLCEEPCKAPVHARVSSAAGRSSGFGVVPFLLLDIQVISRVG
jgi:hypothetical protein